MDNIPRTQHSNHIERLGIPQLFFNFTMSSPFFFPRPYLLNSLLRRVLRALFFVNNHNVNSTPFSSLHTPAIVVFSSIALSDSFLIFHALWPPTSNNTHRSPSFSTSLIFTRKLTSSSIDTYLPRPQCTSRNGTSNASRLFPWSRLLR
jgi:hypothetical protein